nr:hypothetical protein [Tanacetum cinerariifolium]
EELLLPPANADDPTAVELMDEVNPSDEELIG